MKNKIGWCNLTWNPVWGCRNNCEYCYARKMAKRLWKRMREFEFRYHCKKHPAWVWIGDYLSGLKDFKPTFLHSQFDKKFPKKPQRIFVGSMSEIAHWEAKWMNKVIFKIMEYPQHIFQLLTKYPEIYCKWDFPENCWLGITITKDSDINESDLDYYSLDRYLNLECIVFLSLEPLHSNIPNNFIECFDWVIIGAETGNRKGKVIPKKEWITINMTHTELFLLKELLTDIKEGKEIKIDYSTRIELAEPENYFKNLIIDIDRQKRKSNEDVMYYKLAIEVNK